MQRKLLAVAVAGALGAPAIALAQSSTVQIYGTMYFQYDRMDQGRNAANTADLTNTDFLQTPGSSIGFKGEEKLGGGLSAWFQCESTADPRGQSQNGFCSRNSALGLKGGWGNLFVGNWDTPFKRTIAPNTVGSDDTGLWGSASLISAQSTTTAVGAGRAIFKRRQNNSINYDSPSFAGFQVMAAFTAAQTSTGTTSASTSDKPRVISLGAQYRAGPIYVSGAYERHNGFGTVGGENDDRGWHLGANYTWGPVKVGALYTRQKWEASATTESRVNAWHLGVDWRIAGPHGLRASYTEAGDMKGTPGALAAGTGAPSGAGYRPAVAANTGADLWTIRYVYTFSKRTEFNFGYARLDNEAAAQYALNGLAAAVLAGTNQDGFGVALRHTF